MRPSCVPLPGPGDQAFQHAFQSFTVPARSPARTSALACRVPRTGTYKAGLLIRLRRCPCGGQHLRLVTVRMLYLMFVRLARVDGEQGFPMSRVGGRAWARAGARGDFRIHSAWLEGRSPCAMSLRGGGPSAIGAAVSGGRPAPSRLSARRVWMSWMAIEPSPTADATRLTEECRTSPAARTPGMLVSSEYGRRCSGQLQPSGSSSPVSRTRRRLLLPAGAASRCGDVLRSARTTRRPRRSCVRPCGYRAALAAADGPRRLRRPLQCRCAHLYAAWPRFPG